MNAVQIKIFLTKSKLHIYFFYGSLLKYDTIKNIYLHMRLYNNTIHFVSILINRK